MNKTNLSKKEKNNRIIIYSFPFSKNQYLFKDKNDINKVSNDKISNFKQLILNQSNSSLKMFKPCGMANNNISSLLLKTKDQSKISIDNKTNTSSIHALNITQNISFGRTISRSKSIIISRKNKISVNQQQLNQKQSHSINNSHINKSCNLSSEAIDLLNTNIKDIIPSSQPKLQLSSSFPIKKHKNRMNNIKQFTIINSKKKIQNFIQKNHNFSQMKSVNNMILHSFYPIERTQKKRIVKYVNSLNQEILNNFRKNFVLIDNTNFSEEYQFKKKLIDFTKETKPILLNDHILNSNEYLTQSVNTKLANQISTLNHNAKRKKYLRLKTIMIKAAIHMYKWGIPIGDFFKKKYKEVPKYTGEEFYLLLYAIKEMEYKKVDSYITMNRYLLLDCDYMGQTPLHWAAKKNMYRIISYLIRKSSQINALDKVNRTPLHIAAQLNHFESVVVLLFSMSDPFTKTTFGLRPFELAKTYSIQYILKRTEELYIQYKGKPQAVFNTEIRRSLKFVINIELMVPFRNFAPFVIEY